MKFTKRLLSSATAALLLLFCFFIVSAPSQELEGIRLVESDTQIDLSDWVKDYSRLGRTHYSKGELFMRAKQPGFYYVLVGTEEWTSIGSTSQVTLRNVNGAATPLGYGLIFHSDQTPLVQGYAFVIDTLLKRYRVVRHTPKSEKTLQKWTKSDAIRSGKEFNTLAVKDLGDTSELYINGQLVSSVKNTFAFKTG